MQPWFLPAATTLLLAFFLLLATFLLVLRQNRERTTLLWTLGWLFLCLNNLGEVLALWQGGSPLLGVACQLSLTLGLLLILTATLALLSEANYFWQAALGFSLFSLWVMSTTLFAEESPFFRLPTAAAQAAVLLASSFFALRHARRQSSPGGVLLSLFLACWGLYSLIAPFLPPLPAHWHYFLDNGLACGTGLAGLIFLLARWMEKSQAFGEHYRALFNNSRDALFVFHLNEDGIPERLLEANDTASRLLGYGKNELTRIPPGALGAPKTDKDARELFKKLSREKSVFFPWLLLHKSGTTVPVEIDARLVHPAGRPTLLVSARDMSADLQADVKLAESHQRLLRVLDSLEAMVYVSDLNDDRILYANRMVSETYGSVVGRPRREALPITGKYAGEDRGAERLLAGDGTPAAQPYLREAYNPDTWKWYRLQSKAIRWLDDRLVRLEVVTEITEQKEAEKLLQRELSIRTALAMVSEKLLTGPMPLDDVATIIFSQAKAITGSLHGLVGFVDRNTKDLLASTFTEMVEHPDQAAGPDILRFPLGPDDRYPGLLGEALNTGRSFFSNEPDRHPAALGVPSGHIPLRNFLAVPIRFDDETIGQIALANCRDGYSREDLEAIERLGQIYALALLQERTRKEKDRLLHELRQSQKMEAIGTLAGGIAHDFNNILYAILGYAELTLSELPPDGRARANVQEILRGGKRAAELVSQLLVFSRTMEEEKKPLALQFVLKETLKLLRGTIPASVEIREKIDIQCRPILADIAQIHQIIINLCTNAYHAMQKQGGLLSISLDETVLDLSNAAEHPGLATGDYVKLSVQDTGCGMDSRTLKRIFTPGFTTKGELGGTGLGLATVQGIVRGLGGAITVQSEPGFGTTFELLFPVHTGNDDEGAQEADAARELPPLKARILFVDDELAIANMATKMLEKMGCTVKAYTSSIAALQAFAAEPERYDLVISDQAMPELTGYDLARKLLAIRPGLPVILITGFSASLSEEEVRRAGISAFLLKPLSQESLAEAIASSLGDSAAGSPA